MKDLRVQIEKLRPVPGDMLLITLPPHANFEAMRDALRSVLPEGVKALIGPEGTTIENIDPEKLRSLLTSGDRT